MDTIESSTSATDEDGTYTGPGKSVAVANLAPTASVSGPSALQAGDAGTFTLGATDPSSVDQNANFIFKIDWDGNGTVDQTVVGLVGTTVNHTFASASNGLVPAARLVAIDPLIGVPENAVASRTRL